MKQFARIRDNIVSTIASPTGLGNTLWQKQNNNTIRPIAFASRYLNDAEKNYSVGELELLALVYGLEKFLYYLYGKLVHLYTDHQALEPLNKRNRSDRQYSGRLTSWLDRLDYFDFSMKHTAGKSLALMDYLSRHPTEESTTEEVKDEEYVINILSKLFKLNQKMVNC